MSELVTEQPIGDGYVQVSFAGSPVLVLGEAYGFFNPAQLCQQAGREVDRYNELSCKANLESVLQKYSGKVCYRVGRDPRQNPLIAGSYFHPTLLLDLAHWVSPEAFATTAIIVSEIFKRCESLLSDLLDCGEWPTCESVNPDPPKWRIRYTDFEFIVDERGWFDACEFCAAHNKQRDEFMTLCPGVINLRGYLRSKSLFDDRYYHPLLFLRLVEWVDLDCFVKCVRAIFLSGDESLHSLFSGEIISAIKPATSQMTPEEPSSRASQLLISDTMFPRSPLPALNWDNVIIQPEEDVEVELEDEEMDECTMTRKKHEQVLGKLRQELVEKLERERQEEASIRDRLERVQIEKGAVEQLELEKDTKMEELQNLLEDLKIRDLKGPNLRKRAAKPIKEMRYDEIKNLVLYSLEDGSVVAYRRNFSTIVSAIFKDIDKIMGFVGWFITDNAMLDMDRCKNLLKKKAEELGHNFKPMHKTGVKVYEKVDGKFDLPDEMCKILRLDLKVVEADVRLLGRLFKKKTYQDDQAFNPGSDPRKKKYLEQVHKWMEDEFNNHRGRIAKRQRN